MTNWGHSFICIRYLPSSVSPSPAPHTRALSRLQRIRCTASAISALSLKSNYNEPTKCICSNVTSQSAFCFPVIMSIVNRASDTICTTERAPHRVVLAFFSLFRFSVFSLLPFKISRATASSLSFEPTVSPHCRLDPSPSHLSSIQRLFDVVARLALALLCCSHYELVRVPTLTLVGVLQALFWPLEAGPFFLVCGLSSLPVRPGSYPYSAMSVPDPSSVPNNAEYSPANE